MADPGVVFFRHIARKGLRYRCLTAEDTGFRVPVCNLAFGGNLVNLEGLA